MVRSLWSAASGMIAQQTNLDTISNNLANGCSGIQIAAVSDNADKDNNGKRAE